MTRSWAIRLAALMVTVASCVLAAVAGELGVRWKLGYSLASVRLVLKTPPPAVPQGYARYVWNRLEKPTPEPGVETFDPRAVFGEDTATPPNLFRKSFRFSAQWSSNAVGLRGPEIAVPKPSGVLRIVALGGSTTEGIGVGDDETYPALLEKMFASRGVNGRRVEVVNAGFSGFGSHDLYYVFRDLVLPLEPDLVIYYEVGNRVNEREFFVKGPRTERPVIQWIASRFALYRAFRQNTGVLLPYDQTYSFTDRRLTPSLETYLMWMGRIADLARERNVAMVVAEPVDGYRAGLWTSTRVPAEIEWQWERWQPILPEHVSKWYEATAFHMAAFSTARRLPWIPLRTCVGTGRELFLYHNPTMYDPAHYSPRGNARIAQCVADALLPRLDVTRTSGVDP